MQDSILTQLALPALITLIMFGMGLSLTVADFSRVLRLPKAVVTGLIGQFIFMPALALGIALLFSLAAPLAIGLMILAACPAGTMSNVICHAAKANLALSVTLTAFSTVICVFTTPLIISFSIEYFTQTEQSDFSIARTTITLFLMTIVPVAIGIFMKHKFSDIADYLEPYFRRFSGVFVVIMIVAISIQERETLVSSFQSLFGATIALNLSAIAAGLALGALVKLSAKDGVTLGIEVGVQNAALAILIAVSILQNTEYATTAGVYGVTMYIGALLLAVLAKKSDKAVSAA